ncbi:MAG: amino acid ABC transporter substrate-binding protein [Desulfobacterales bacterium]|nr:amino acid ABC transporter substrate-binding protein [Desulfobacterales bacterium]MDJ0888555.1 amino acid ABC transporter substrate-binding protein [Desulfobacterales bacterium]
MHKTLGVILTIVLTAVPLSAQELTGTLEKIDKSGRIRIGYRETEPPMSFLNEDNQPAGYTIDICRAVVAGIEDKIGRALQVDFIPVTADNRFKALRKNSIDLLCGSTTQTLSRRELVDFTQLTFVTGASFMTLKDNQKIGEAGLEGSRIGVVRATTTETALRQLIRDTSTNAEIILFDAADKGLDALRQKKIDAFSSDQVVLLGLALKASDTAAFTVKSDVFSFEPFALAVRRNDADFRLVADRVIAELYRSRKILPIYDRWIGKYVGRRLPAFEAMIQINATPE